MANYKTGAQRYNDRKDKIFDTARRLEKDPVTKSYRRHQRTIGVAVKDKGSHYPGPKKNDAMSKALEKKKDNRPLTGKGHKYYESIEHDFLK